MARRRGSPTLVIGVLFSIALTFFLLSRGIDPPSSTIIGLTGVAISLLLEVLSRIGKMEDRLASAAGLSRELARDVELFSAITGVVSDYQSVLTTKDLLFISRAKHLVNECVDRLHQLSEGRMILPPLSDFSFGLKGFDQVESTLKSTSYVDTEHFWNSVAGERYFQKNEEIVRRGVSLIRVFIGSRDELARLQATISRHKRSGMQVLVALTDETPEELCEDYLIADDRVLVSLELTREGRARLEKISVDPQEVRRSISNFTRLTAIAYEYEQLFPRGEGAHEPLEP